MSKKPATTLPDFAPVPRLCARHDGWTPERQVGFIEKLADYGSVRAAANAVGMTPESAYQLRRQPEADGFARAWQAALDLGIARVEDTAMDRALNGMEVPVYAYGKIIGTRTVYNDRLLMFMLRNRASKRFAAHGANGLNAVDRSMLARMKKEWRREWERERAQTSRPDTGHLAALSAKIKLGIEREVAVRLMLANDPDGGLGDDEEEEEDYSTELPEEMRHLLPRKPVREVDDGWDVIHSYDEEYGEAAEAALAAVRPADAQEDAAEEDGDEKDGTEDDRAEENGA